MPAGKTRVALGLMSGTSLDGVDAAIIHSDGESVSRLGPWRTTAYPAELREMLVASIGIASRHDPGDAIPRLVQRAERVMTEFHARIINELLEENSITVSNIDIIGFHGQTILHRPEARRTWQIGDGPLLARLAGIDVVSDFRSADVRAGGQGAPLAPLYHQALAGAPAAGITAPRVFPVAVLNVGGVANVTWLAAPGGHGPAPQIVAFDTGPGNALIDDWMTARENVSCDHNGETAARGRVDDEVLARLLDHDYFGRLPPKSLDRNDFLLSPASGLSTVDGAATLTEFTARAAARAVDFFPAPARSWIVCGGGRHNPTLMAALGRNLDSVVVPAEALGWRGDVLEAETFAFLAVRSVRGLPLSLPSTTGAPRPLSGGRLHKAPVI